MTAGFELGATYMILYRGKSFAATLIGLHPGRAIVKPVSGRDAVDVPLRAVGEIVKRQD